MPVERGRRRAHTNPTRPPARANRSGRGARLRVRSPPPESTAGPPEVPPSGTTSRRGRRHRPVARSGRCGRCRRGASAERRRGDAPLPPRNSTVVVSRSSPASPLDPAALDAAEDRHQSEPGAAARHHVGRGVAALARETADRMGEIPEIAKRLPLHGVEQRLPRARAGREGRQPRS